MDRCGGRRIALLFVFGMQQQEKILLAARDLLGLSVNEGLMSFPEFITSPEGLALAGVYPFWLKEASVWNDRISSIVLTGSLGGGKCILDQRVVTDKGYRYISSLCPSAEDGWSDIEVGMEQPDGSYAVADKFYKESNAAVNLIHGSRGIVYSGTDEHPLYVWCRGWSAPQLLRCGELQEGDFIARRRGGPLRLTSSQTACREAYLRGGIAYRKGSVDLESWFHGRDCAFFGLCGLLEAELGDIRGNCIHFVVGADFGVSVCEALDYLGLDYTKEEAASGVDVGLWSDATQTFVSWWRDLWWVLDGCPRCYSALCSSYLRSVDAEEPCKCLLGQEELDIETEFNVSLDRVSKIEQGRGTVYDVCVPTTHLFQSQGVVNHNSSYANMLICYYLYRVFSHGDLYSYYGIMRGTPIYILYFSVNLKTAERSGFKQLRVMLDNAPWFLKNMPRDKSVDSSIRFGNGLNIEFASGESHAIGLSVVGTILDEANFRKGVGSGLMSEFSEVQQLAQQLEDRLKSRFSRDGGTRMLSLMVYISSASYASSFIEEKMLELATVSYGRVVRAVQYKICPQNYSPEFFEVFCGYNQVLPCIVKDAAHKATLVKSIGRSALECESYFERVPVDFLSQFKKNIYLAIQNHCGRSTVAQGAFITNYEVVLEAYDAEVLAERPVSQDSIVVSNQDDIAISSIFDFDSYVYADRPHSLTLDLSLTGDHGSLCCVRCDGQDANGRGIHTEVFNLDIVPPQFPGMLHISKVEDFLLWLAEHIHVVAFSTDAFQSEQLRQNVCAQLGITNIRLSLDSSDIPALLWLGLLVDGRAKMQYLERQDREIREAVHEVSKHRVVKRSGSTDDQFQAMCGAFFLSETVGARELDLSSVVGSRVNLCGEGPIRRMLLSCGYDVSEMFYTKEDARALSKEGGSGNLTRETLEDIHTERSRVARLSSVMKKKEKPQGIAAILAAREGAASRAPKVTEDAPVRKSGGVWSLIDMVDKF